MSQIKKSDKNKLVAELEKGYKEMADINLELAQMCRRLGIWQSTAPKHHGENAPNWRRLEREEWLSPALRNNQKTPQYPIRFWTNGMYYLASTNQYFMMRFNKLSMLNNCSR